MEAPSSPLSSRPERSEVERSAVSSPQTTVAGHNDPPLCHLDRSEAKWRDLRFLLPRPRLRAITTLPFVISTEAKRSGEICGFFSPDHGCGPQRPSPLSSRPERSEVERSAVSSPQTTVAGHNDPPLCHLDRSEAKWRDLRFLLPPKRKRDQERFLISFADDRTTLVNLEENDDQREQGQ
jgi:hypothetical protein